VKIFFVEVRLLFWAPSFKKYFTTANALLTIKNTTATINNSLEKDLFRHNNQQIFSKTLAKKRKKLIARKTKLIP
jgi:hypothetical protein